MKTIQLNLYTISELDAEVKKKVLNKFRYINVDHGWWNDIYEEAKSCGLIIEEFDLYPKSIKIKRDLNVDVIADKVIEHYGDNTDVYKAAVAFKENWTTLDYDNQVDWFDPLYNAQLDGKLNAIVNEFMGDLKKGYMKFLEQEYEERTDDQYVESCLNENEDWFASNGDYIPLHKIEHTVIE